MNYLYTAILICLALSILTIPFLKNKNLSKKYFFFTVLFVSLFSTSLYFFTTNFSALNEWENHGKEHYQLLVE